MKLKKGAVIQGLQLPMRKVLMFADAIWKANGKELVVTSGVDGVHSPGSLHPFGYAVDLRTFYFTNETKKKVRKLLADNLGPEYDVVLEPTHIHAEYQRVLDDYGGV